MPRADRRAQTCSLAELVVLTRPSFSTARRKRLCNLSHLRQTLNPGVPVLPYLRASCDALGQWLVCCADASPTEDPDTASPISRENSIQLQSKTVLSNLSRKIDITYAKFIFSSYFPYISPGYSPRLAFHKHNSPKSVSKEGLDNPPCLPDACPLTLSYSAGGKKHALETASDGSNPARRAGP